MQVIRAAGIFAMLTLLVLPSFGNVPRGAAAAPGANTQAVEHAKKTRETSRYLPDRVVLKLQADAVGKGTRTSFGVPSLDAFVSRYGAASVARIFQDVPSRPLKHAAGKVDLSPFYELRFSGPVDPFVVAEELSRQPGVEYAEPSFVYEVSDASVLVPNDPNFAKQWHLVKVKADSAWNVSQGDTSVVIGIIDTGVQWDHPDLAANIWLNPGESGPDGLGGDKSNNNLDDDGDGFIDDYHGWDFGGADYLAPSGDNNPSPVRASHGHGTHTAGLASAVTNNATGIAGIGYTCKILPVKASSDNDLRGAQNTPYITYGFEGIVYAALMGADIISLSWGGPGYSQYEQDIITAASNLGSLIFAAAGNTASAADPQYPASYDRVFSVAATQVTDVKASYSSYGEFVDLCAPGGDTFDTTKQILSTYYPNTYAYDRGTSMSTPLAAGAAALVRAQFPSYTPTQVGEQLRVTCDDIYGPNSTYRYKLGKGRINVYRALTASSPSVRMSKIVARDSIGGNNNGTFEPNEDVRISLTLTNYLQPTTGAATATLTSTSAYVTITSGAFPFGAIGTMGTSDNSAAPFVVHVASNMPSSTKAPFLLTITDGSYVDRFEFSLFFNPTYATHFVNNVDVTLTNNGKIGFNDFPNNTQGIGFIYNGLNQLFEGGIMIGYSATKIVDNVRNTSGIQDVDLNSSTIYDLKTPGTVSDQDGSTIFTDAPAVSTNKLGIQVTMSSYEYVSAPHDNYVILRYDIKNTNLSALSGVYAGLFFDWDMYGPANLSNDYGHNRTGYDASRALGYAYYDTTAPTTYCGAKALTQPAGFRGLVNDSLIVLTRAAKYAWLSGGVVTDSRIGDIHLAVSSGPFSFAGGETKTVAFALLGGTGLAELQASADAAQSKWTFLTDVASDAPGIPAVYALRQNYPNPFNPTTMIAYDLPEASAVSLRVVDLLGREVAVLAAGDEQSAGTHRVSFDGNGLASGVYFYQLRARGLAAGSGAAEFSDVKKLLLMR